MYPISMHIYFSGIGGAGIGPLAQIASQAGYEVSGSDQQASSYIDYLKKHGLNSIQIGQSTEGIAAVHAKQPIDWFVYSSSIVEDHPELVFCRENGIKTSKRDELLNEILRDKDLKLIAIAGTHGKTTTTAMVVWLFKELGLPVSYSVGAKLSFGDMGHYEPGSEYFIYEADEFDRNFLAFEPFISLITGVSWDHHEVFPTREDYQAAFREFIDQSAHTFIWEEDADYLGVQISDTLTRVDSGDPEIDMLTLKGKYNRLDAWLAAAAVMRLTGAAGNELIAAINRFAGLSRRMEPIIPNLYSDYAHTPEKIRGAMSVAREMANESGQKLVVVYEPLTNRRQHYMKDDYKDCFDGADQLYWIPSYLAREDPSQPVLSPSEMIEHLDNPSIAEPIERDSDLKQVIQQHLDAGDMVVAMAGGGGNSLDDWLRRKFTA
jgi:UDP-N-acetylmuramate--alanine ligase